MLCRSMIISEYIHDKQYHVITIIMPILTLTILNFSIDATDVTITIKDGYTKMLSLLNIPYCGKFLEG